MRKAILPAFYILHLPKTVTGVELRKRLKERWKKHEDTEAVKHKTTKGMILKHREKEKEKGEKEKKLSKKKDLQQKQKKPKLELKSNR